MKRTLYVAGTALAVATVCFTFRDFMPNESRRRALSSIAEKELPHARTIPAPPNSPTRVIAELQPAHMSSVSTQSLAARTDPKSLFRRSGKPSWLELAGLRSEDLPQLKIEYRATTNLLQKEALTWALGFIGDEETVSLLQKTLLVDYAGKPLAATEVKARENEEAVLMLTTIGSIGLLGHRHDSAIRFLLEGSEPEFWKGQNLWSSRTGDQKNGLLAGFCIQGFGLCARPETEGILESLKSKTLLDMTVSEPLLARSLAGDVHQAAFWFSIVRAEGRDGFLRWFFTDTHTFDADGRFAAWTSSPDGQKWGDWLGKKEPEIEMRRQRMIPPTARR